MKRKKFVTVVTEDDTVTIRSTCVAGVFAQKQQDSELYTVAIVAYKDIADNVKVTDVPKDEALRVVSEFVGESDDD